MEMQRRDLLLSLYSVLTISFAWIALVTPFHLINSLPALLILPVSGTMAGLVVVIRHRHLPKGCVTAPLIASISGIAFFLLIAWLLSAR